MTQTRALPTDIDLLALHRLAPGRYPVLFESSASGAHGRWDMLLAHAGERLELQRDGVVRGQDGHAHAGKFLDVLDAHWRALRCEHDADAYWPFRGGWALFLGYELAAQIEPILHLPAAEGGLPVACALRCPAAVLRDRVSGECIAIAEADQAGWLDRIEIDIAALDDLSPLPAWQAPVDVQEEPPQRFIDGVARILDYLAAGDVFQVSLSRGWQVGFEAPLQPAALFQRLRDHNPAPFAGVFAGGASDGTGWSVVSASPERLVSVQGREVATRPIAGTRPRFDGDDDAARIRELVGHPKERAEHVMLIDLERNDLGRVCTPGSVVVDELMIVESYPHVHHIVSNVRGILKDDATPGAVIAAVFPGGTITGCPKIRCMQIIAELEGQGRGAYTGAMGWLNRDGDMDLNILIRSAEIESGALRFRNGAGIVIDSNPRYELDETRAKARGMLHALGVAG
ncbi:aminodeoxychorismate synthase component I [Thermomonas sp.]|uniref:aminodeoxychorismate synthase component I n=1 Tax=Thermomonas sp. TaxID=1971895 RepID=UPI0024889DE8|nr:aminodeoxychorismate synthase component I [Thermomonas sp.]MDI1253782.1 aminodeoxychorismate synthase component I [Thermomonas sp.]